MFEQFSPTNKTNWKAQIEKDLKGKPYEELIWHLSEELHFEPFYTRAELGQPAPLNSNSGNNWHIAEPILVDDYKTSNSKALEGLMGGAEALELAISKKPTAAEMAQLFDQVELTYIAVHFRLQDGDIGLMEAVLEQFSSLVDARAYPPHEIRGSIGINLIDKQENWEKVKHILNRFKLLLPQFRLLTIEAAECSKTEEVLVHCLEKAVLAVDRLSDLGMSVADVHEQISFRLLIGKQYFVEIASIRALKLLWLHIQKAYNVEALELPPIGAGCNVRDYNADQNMNMIRATTIALSAAIGGVDCLAVLPSDLKGETAFQRRIARNVQHLLKMESYIDRVSDPAAGAYYIEKMTADFAGRAWEIFSSK